MSHKHPVRTIAIDGPARDAVILDSTELSAEETLAQAIALVEARNAALAPHQSAP